VNTIVALHGKSFKVCWLRAYDTTTHERIIALRSGGRSIAETAKLAGCSESQVKRIWSMRAAVPA
jgi:predicted nuclease of predicted toxin-antitoxin system